MQPDGVGAMPESRGTSRVPARRGAGSGGRVSSLHRVLRLTGRACWLSLVLVHLPELFSVGRQFIEMPGMARAGSLLALVATVAVFALKAYDVPWLRLRGGRASTLVLFLVLCAVAHPQVMATVFRHAPAITGSIVVTHIVVQKIPARWRRSWRDWASRIATRRRFVVADRARFIRTPLLRDLSLAVATLSRVPRAPPCAT